MQISRKNLESQWATYFPDGKPREEDLNWDGGDHDIEERNNFLNIEYNFKNNKTINPYIFNLSLEKATKQECNSSTSIYSITA